MTPRKSPFVHFFWFHLSFPTCINLRASYPAPSPLALFIFLSFNHADFTVSFCQLCFVIFYLYRYITRISDFHLNLAAHHLLNTTSEHLSFPLGSICDCSQTFFPVCFIPTCSVPPFVAPSLSGLPPCIPLLLCGHAGAYVPSLSLPALPDLDHSGSGPLHPGSLHLLLV